MTIGARDLVALAVANRDIDPPHAMHTVAEEPPLGAGHITPHEEAEPTPTPTRPRRPRRRAPRYRTTE